MTMTWERTTSVPLHLNPCTVLLLRCIHRRAIPDPLTSRDFSELMLVKAMGLALCDIDGWRLTPFGFSVLRREDGVQG